MKLQDWRTQDQTKQEKEPQRSHMKQNVMSTSTVGSTDALVTGMQWHLVAPELRHFEALGVPDVGLQPDVAPLAAGILGQKVTRAPAVLTTGSFSFRRVRLRSIKTRH